MNGERATSCSVTAYYVRGAPSDGVNPAQEWLAIATAHVYVPNPDTKGVLTPEGAVASGAVMKTVEGRASATSEAGALSAAVRALHFQLEALGHTKKPDA